MDNARTMQDLIKRKQKLEAEIAAAVELDVAAVLSGEMPSRSALVVSLAQDREIFDCAIKALHDRS